MLKKNTPFWRDDIKFCHDRFSAINVPMDEPFRYSLPSASCEVFLNGLAVDFTVVEELEDEVIVESTFTESGELVIICKCDYSVENIILCEGGEGMYYKVSGINENVGKKAKGTFDFNGIDTGEFEEMYSKMEFRDFTYINSVFNNESLLMIDELTEINTSIISHWCNNFVNQIEEPPSTGTPRDLTKANMSLSNNIWSVEAIADEYIVVFHIDKIEDLSKYDFDSILNVETGIKTVYTQPSNVEGDEAILCFSSISFFVSFGSGFVNKSSEVTNGVWNYYGNDVPTNAGELWYYFTPDDGVLVIRAETSFLDIEHLCGRTFEVKINGTWSDVTDEVVDGAWSRNDSEDVITEWRILEYGEVISSGTFANAGDCGVSTINIKTIDQSCYNKLSYQSDCGVWFDYYIEGNLSRKQAIMEDSVSFLDPKGFPSQIFSLVHQPLLFTSGILDWVEQSFLENVINSNKKIVINEQTYSKADGAIYTVMNSGTKGLIGTVLLIGGAVISLSCCEKNKEGYRLYQLTDVALCGDYYPDWVEIDFGSVILLGMGTVIVRIGELVVMRTAPEGGVAVITYWDLISAVDSHSDPRYTITYTEDYKFRITRAKMVDYGLRISIADNYSFEPRTNYDFPTYFPITSNNPGANIYDFDDSGLYQYNGESDVCKNRLEVRINGAWTDVSNEINTDGTWERYTNDNITSWRIVDENGIIIMVGYF